MTGPRVIAGFSLAIALAIAGDPRPRIRADRLGDDIRRLASPEMNGRGAGTEGLRRAGEWIAAEFARIGLKPAGDAGGFKQTFKITSGARLGPDNSLVCEGCGNGDLESGKHFSPLPMSVSGEVRGGLVFAGYGITAPECAYDDYAGIDVRGQTVVVLRHEPQEYDSKSPFDGRVYTEHSQLMRKVLNARDHGAAAVLLVHDTGNHSGGEVLEPFTALPGPGRAGIPVVQVLPATVEKWFEAAGRNFQTVQSGIDTSLLPASFRFPDSFQITLRTDVSAEEPVVFNVAAYLPGNTPEYVIVGAHYDHLGLGEQFSMSPDKAGTHHPGADDNASGTAGLLAMARALASEQPMRRGVLFLAFSSEEIGLLGSTHYTANPLRPLRQATAMLNMDMIGRLKDRKLTVGAVASGEGLRQTLERLARQHSLELQLDDDAVYGSSDHTAFKARSIPVLFFFTGLHADYHRPTDSADKIDRKATARVVELATAAVVDLAQSPQKVAFVGSGEKKALTLPGMGR